MGKRLPYTPNSTIRAALRRLFLRSRERAACLKAHNYTCSGCGKKQSKAKGREVKVEVHHKDGVLNWEELFLAIRKFILCDPNKMNVLCKDCHDRETSREAKNKG